MWHDSPLYNHGIMQQPVELHIPPHCQLDMTGVDTLTLEVMGCLTCQLFGCLSASGQEYCPKTNQQRAKILQRCPPLVRLIGTLIVAFGQTQSTFSAPPCTTHMALSLAWRNTSGLELPAPETVGRHGARMTILLGIVSSQKTKNSSLAFSEHPVDLKHLIRESYKRWARGGGLYIEM
jgi:hypothetical protein